MAGIGVIDKVQKPRGGALEAEGLPKRGILRARASVGTSRGIGVGKGVWGGLPYVSFLYTIYIAYQLYCLTHRGEGEGAKSSPIPKALLSLPLPIPAGDGKSIMIGLVKNNSELGEEGEAISTSSGIGQWGLWYQYG
jgi:hypothetical protein